MRAWIEGTVDVAGEIEITHERPWGGAVARASMTIRAALQPQARLAFDEDFAAILRRALAAGPG